jgi:ribosomal protein S18 acetylase RimI-like enzyme
MFNTMYNLLNLKPETEQLVIRQVEKDDPYRTKLGAFFEELREEDKKFLALLPKLSHINTVIRSGKHCYMALLHETVVGFMRESGRPEGYSLLEEIAVLPNYRGQGIGRKMLQQYHRIFPKTLAKTSAKNLVMISLLERTGYTADNPNAPRIINWSRDTGG